MNGQNYIDLAMQHLDTEDEATIRCAVSRCYYGILHKSIEKLIDINSDEYLALKENLTYKQSQDSSIHTSVTHAVKELNKSTFTMIDIAKRLRVIADYYFDTKFSNSVIKVMNFDDTNLKTFNTTQEIKDYLQKTSERIDTLKMKEKRHNMGNSIDLKQFVKHS